MSTSYGFVSTHPPTECGLATFNSALAAQLAPPGSPGGIVRLAEHAEAIGADANVAHSWLASDEDGWQLAAKAINHFDVAIVQHEYGIYPGADGADVVPFLRELSVPSIVVLHTVLATPTTGQKEVLEAIGSEAGALVTMTATARERLISGYDVDPAKVNVIPHGAIDHTEAPVEKGQRPHLLTWGLLGPGKGIEWAIRSLGRLRQLDPRPYYTIAGKTHPRVLERHGEEYRESLQRLAETLSLTDSVHFDPVYRDDASLSRLIRSADVVVLPYESREQVTSGVLTEAVAAGIPVVATPFPHAIELLTNGPGLLVPFGDAAAMGSAIREILTRPDMVVSPAASPSVLWPEVAARYAVLAQHLMNAHQPVSA